MESSQTAEGPAAKKIKSGNPDSEIVIEGEDYEALAKLLKCPKCSKRLNPPVRICQSRGCIQCPHCSKYYPGGCGRYSNSDCGSFMNEDCTLNKILQLFPVKCTYTNQGCLEKMQIKDIILHEKNCDFRNIECFACDSSVVFSDLNEHIAEHDDQTIIKANFLNHFKLEIKPLVKTDGYFIIFVETIKKHFLFAYNFYKSINSYSSAKEVSERYLPFTLKNYNHGLDYFEFCLQCIGKKDEASFYMYEFKIDQGLSSYYTCTAKSASYMDESKAVCFSTADVFLNNDYKSGFNIWITIKPPAPILHN